MWWLFVTYRVHEVMYTQTKDACRAGRLKAEG